MGGFTQSVLNALLAWLRTGITGLWDVVNSKDAQTGLEWLGANWWLLVLVLAVGGIVVDYLVWFVRWRPFYVWRSSWRRFKRHFKKEKHQKPAVSAQTMYKTPAYEPEPYKSEAYEQNIAYEEPFYEEIPAARPVPQLEETAYQPPKRPGRRSATTRQRTGLFGSVARNIKENLRETADDGEFAPYAPPKPRVDKRAAFHRPAYPPGWQAEAVQEDSDFQEE